jgi:hypothetical protein
MENLAMNYKLTGSDARFSAVLLSPFDRLEAGATWAKASAAIGALAQYAYHDAFIGALAFVIVSGIADYIVGVKAARLAGAYDVQTAHRGALGKISGLLLLLLVRTFEHYLFLQGLTPNTRGVMATAIAISLFAVDLQSIAHHREELGAQPIPVLGRFLEWLQSLAGSKIPPDPATPARRADDVKP